MMQSNRLMPKEVAKSLFPEGLWLTGPIELLSNVNLYTEKNALVLFSADHSLYPIINTSFEGLKPVVASLLFQHVMLKI